MMGTRGPHRQPPELKRLRGNPGKRRIEDLVVVPEGEPLCPDHLSDDGAACFEMIVRSMPPGVFTRVDRYTLAAFAETWSLHKKAVEKLKHEPLIIEGKNGRARNPLVTIIAVQARLLVTLGARLGLDPAARASLGVAEPASPRNSKFDGLIAGEPGFRRRFDA